MSITDAFFKIPTENRRAFVTSLTDDEKIMLNKELDNYTKSSAFEARLNNLPPSLKEDISSIKDFENSSLGKILTGIDKTVGFAPRFFGLMPPAEKLSDRLLKDFEATKDMQMSEKIKYQTMETLKEAGITGLNATNLVLAGAGSTPVKLARTSDFLGKQLLKRSLSLVKYGSAQGGISAGTKFGKSMIEGKTVEQSTQEAKKEGIDVASTLIAIGAGSDIIKGIVKNGIKYGSRVPNWAIDIVQKKPALVLKDRKPLDLTLKDIQDEIIDFSRNYKIQYADELASISNKPVETSGLKKMLTQLDIDEKLFKQDLININREMRHMPFKEGSKTLIKQKGKEVPGMVMEGGRYVSGVKKMPDEVIEEIIPDDIENLFKGPVERRTVLRVKEIINFLINNKNNPSMKAIIPKAGKVSRYGQLKEALMKEADEVNPGLIKLDNKYRDASKLFDRLRETFGYLNSEEKVTQLGKNIATKQLGKEGVLRDLKTLENISGKSYIETLLDSIASNEFDKAGATDIKNLINRGGAWAFIGSWLGMATGGYPGALIGGAGGGLIGTGLGSPETAKSYLKASEGYRLLKGNIARKYPNAKLAPVTRQLISGFKTNQENKERSK